jgi:rare lipoprotein A (peptidoglycan hydrolase)
VVRALGRLNVYRRSVASVFGPGLYGSALACGGHLSPGTIGVASKSLPCGAKVTFHNGSHTVQVPVVDRGPYVGGRDWDLTTAAARRLGFGYGVGTVLSTR